MAGANENLNSDYFELELEESDSLDTLTKAFEVTQEVIAEANPEINLAQLTPGQRVRLPFPIRCRGTIYIVRRGDTLASIAAGLSGVFLCGNGQRHIVQYRRAL